MPFWELNQASSLSRIGHQASLGMDWMIDTVDGRGDRPSIGGEERVW